jgi:hypothetical protein
MKHPEHPDFGIVVWDSPNRNQPFTLPFYPITTAQYGRHRQVAGSLTHEGRTYSVMVRTQQPQDSINTLIATARGAVWMLNGRAEGWIEFGDAGDEYRPVTAWVQQEEP